MGITILLIVLFQLIFIGIYELWFKKQTFFTGNRLYLILSPIVSIVIPFVSWSPVFSDVPKLPLTKLPVFINELSTVDLGSISSPTTMKFPVGDAALSSRLFLIFWGLGALISLGIFGYKCYTIYRISKKGKVKVSGGIRHVPIPDRSVAFSFLNTIYLGSELSKEQRACVLRHEAIHIKHKHSLDLLYFELLRVFFWFNPLIYRFQRRIQQLHEYIVDAEMLASTSKKQYVDGLLSQVFQTTDLSFANSFFTHSFIKNRIMMLQKSKSSPYQQLRYIAIMPLLFLMIFCTSGMQQVLGQTPTKTTADSKIEQQQQTETLPYAVIDIAPAFKGCETIADRKERADCTSQKVSSFVNKNFDLKAAEAVSQEGPNRIFVRFKIDKQGQVVDVDARAANPVLRNIAIEAVSALPTMIPGQHEGKVVNVLYSLPITFSLKN